MKEITMRKFVPIDRTGLSGETLGRIVINVDQVVQLEPNNNGITRIITTQGDDSALWTKVPADRLLEWFNQ